MGSQGRSRRRWRPDGNKKPRIELDRFVEEHRWVQLRRRRAFHASDRSPSCDEHSSSPRLLHCHRDSTAQRPSFPQPYRAARHYRSGDGVPVRLRDWRHVLGKQAVARPLIEG